MLVDNLIHNLKVAESPLFSPADFALSAVNVLRQFIGAGADIAQFLEQAWDEKGCLPIPADFGEGPSIIMLHNEINWCVRVTIWPPVLTTNWADVIHDHFGFIATTAITDIAYSEEVFRSFADLPMKGTRRDLRRGNVCLLRPETIHRILLPPECSGISLSVRTRAVRENSWQFDERAGAAIPRTRGAAEAKKRALTMLSAAGLREKSTEFVEMGAEVYAKT